MKIYIIPFLCLISLSAFSQNAKKDSIGIMPGFVNPSKSAQDNSVFQKSNLQLFGNSFSLSIPSDIRKTKDEILIDVKNYLELSDDFKFNQFKQHIDAAGIQHTQFQTLFKGIPILGQEIIINEINNKVNTVIGSFLQIIPENSMSKVSRGEALEIAKNSFDSVIFQWEDTSFILFAKNSIELNLDQISPKIDLYYMFFDKRYVLCYRIIAGTSFPLDEFEIIVDAVSGRILNKHSTMLYADAPGNGTTIYRGNKPITTDAHNGYYRLRESGRNIETYNMRGKGYTSYLSWLSFLNSDFDYTKSDNSWSNIPYLDSVRIQTVNNNWTTAFEDLNGGLPDIYVSIKDNDGNEVYRSETTDNHLPPLTYSNSYLFYKIPLSNPPYTLEIRDEDITTDDLLGSFTFNLTPGVYSFPLSNGTTGSYRISLKSNPAIDVHWGMEKSYDFFKNNLDRDSYDDHHSKIKNFTNIPNNFLYPALRNSGLPSNALAHPSLKIMLYGWGNNISTNPYVGLDVEGHEYAHLVSNEIATLGTSDGTEGRALNEAIADMFATAIEKYADPSSFNWTIGEGISKCAPFLRSLQNPKDPALVYTCFGISKDDRGSDTYLDDIWNSSSTSYKWTTVADKWFYLIANPGTTSGSNYFNRNYSVNGLGMDRAIYIVYNSLFNLGWFPDYSDFVNATMTFTGNYYGFSSPDYIAVQNAWYAVNLWDTPGSSVGNQCQSTTILNSPSGIFDDGSGTTDYLNNTDCKWLIKPSGATSITLKFNYLNTESGKDTVIVYNGNTITSPRIGVYSGTTFPDSIVVSGSQVLVRFKTDGANTAQGWSIKYTSNSVSTSSCSGLQSLTSASGTITDGSGTSNYVNNAECSWLIAPPGASSVTLNFTAFNTEANYDFVKVYNGNNTYAPVLGTFSGTSLPSSLTANSGEMLVVFTTDGRTTAAGWSANYTSSGSSYCSGTQTLTTATGTLSDGSGSNNYQNRLDCNWLIKPTGASSVTLIFDSLDVENPPIGLPGTFYDYVNVYDGQNANATLLGTYAGSDIPPPITSSGNALFLVFHTDGRTTARGWNAHYTSSTGQYCAGTTSLTTASGSFTDGSGASNYQSNSDCRWLIQPANATSIELTISPCDVEPNNDGILVYDGATVNAPLLGVLTGNISSRSFTSSSGQMLVRFQSDAQNNYPGFSASYTANISPLGSNYYITGYEYWFDDNSNNRTFVSTPHVYAYNLNTGIPVNTLATGVHTLNIRFLDNQDKWSSVLSSLFYKGLEDNNTINNITAYEYWFDNNYGNKTAVSVSAQKILNLNTGLNTASLSTGIHVLNIRFKDTGNQWSSVLSSLFYKGLEDNNSINNITDYEYWFDNNYASKVSTTVTPQKALSLNTGLSVSSLQQGVHMLNIRFKDSGKQWSSVLSQLFYKNGTTTSPVNKVSAYRYWYDRSTSNITTVILPSPVNPHELISNIDVSTLTAGTHTVHFQFKDLTDSWSSVTNDTFNVVAPIKANFIANDTTLCYRGTVTFTNQSTGAVSYLWKFGDGDSSTTANPSHTYNTPGFYTVTLVATNNQGVKDTLRKVNYISVTVPNVGVSPNVSICIGTSTQLVATGAITYVWSPATGLNTTTGSTVTATPGSNTTYRVIGTDQYGCIDTAFVTVNVSSVLQVGLSASQTTICQGDTVTLMASGANSYTWSPSVGLNSTMGSTVRAFPSVTTTYSVVGTSTCGSDTERVTITVKPKPNTSAGRDTSICAGKSVLLTATGATIYVWNNGINTAANTVTPASTTSYIVTGTTNGCSSSDTVNVTVRSLPSVSIPDVTICPGGSYTFDAGNPGSSYLWQNNTTSQQLTANTAGLYWVQVTNTFGCVKRDSAIVSLSPSLTINLRDTAVCQGQTVTLNAGNPGATYLWSNGSQTQSISVNQGGSYSVLVTGSGGCTGRDTAIVTIKPLPSTDAGRDTAICAGKSVLLTATGATTYAWGNGVNTAGNTVAPISTTSYVVTGTTNGCSSSDTVNVTVRPLPSVNLPDVNICPGGSYTFDAGNPGSSYLWQNNTTSQQLTANTAGLYWVQVTNTFGCVKRDSAIVSLSPSLTINLRDTAVCQGQTVTLNAGNPGATYLWSNGSQTQSISVNQGGSYSILVTGSGGCTGRDTAIVTVKPLPSTDAGRDTAICAGKSVLLTATGATTYAWGNGINTAANTVTPASNTSYIVIGTTNGCSSSDTVNVTVRSSPSVNLPDVNICPGGSYTFDAGNPGSSYLWQNNTTSQQLTANSAGLYWVQVTNSFGCIKRDSAILTLNSNLTIGLRDTSICTGQSVTLNAGNPGATYLWNTGAGTQTITVTQSNTYSVLVTANGGCFKRDTAVVTILPLPTVTLSLADTVSLNTPPFSLTGGLPTGGSYSGAGVAGGIFNPSVAGPGNHVITYTYTDVNGCSNLKKDSIFVQIVTGIKDNKNDLYISLYPNPSNGIIKFSVNNVKDENGDIEVLNNLGQILYSDKIKIINSSEFTFDISNFASGVYYLKIRINDQFRTYPIEVVK